MKRNPLPTAKQFLGTIFLNGFVGCVVLHFLTFVFGDKSLFSLPQFGDMSRWERILWQLPGLGLSFSLLWVRLIRDGRKEMQVPWNTAILHGIVTGFGNILFTGFLIGTISGNIAVGLMMALIAFATLLLQPNLVIAIICLGAILGYYNGKQAQNWLTENYKE